MEGGKIIKGINATRPTATLTRSTIVTTGYKLGFRSQDGRGAPTMLSLHAKVDRLIGFILKLYSEYDDLPAIPKQVRTAMDSRLGPAKEALEKLSA